MKTLFLASLILVSVQAIAFASECNPKSALQIAVNKSVTFDRGQLNAQNAFGKCVLIGSNNEGPIVENYECLVTIPVNGTLVGFFYKLDKDTCEERDSLGLQLSDLSILSR